MQAPLVLLRSLEASDKANLARLLNNKNIWDNLRDHIPFPYSESDAEFFINLAAQENPKQNFAIEYHGNICGVIGLVKQNDVFFKSAEIGYWIGEEFWRKGIATKAVELMVRYGFDELDLIRIYAGIFDFNLGSMKVLENNGFKKEGVFRDAIIKNDKICDEHRFYILKNMVGLGIKN